MLMSFILISLALFALGSIIGSFLNVVIYRSVVGESWVRGRSRCDHCRQQIAWYDNIPLLSFMILKGKCRACAEPISISHPVVELMTGLLFVWWYWGGSLFFQLTRAPFQTLQPLFWLSIALLLLVLFFSDLLYMVLPDIVTGLLMVLTTLYRLALVLAGIMEPMDLLRAVMGMVLATTLFGGLWLITKGKGMGFGDVKLIIPLSLLVGWPAVMALLMTSFVLGAMTGVGLIMVGKKRFGQVIPFGPFLILSTAITLVWGNEIIHWYTSLL
jgi:leader peptidase (prepilin peptidase)/N-methyltransferase